MNKILLSATLVVAFVGSRTAWAACSHPYFPTKVGTEWHFEDTDDNKSIIKVVKNEGSSVEFEATFVDSEDGDELKSKFSGTCGETGFQMNMAEMFIAAAPEGMGGLQASFESFTGATLPPASKMKAGESWKQSGTMLFGTEEMPAAMKATMKITNTVVGTEKVTVGAGTFEAVKIKFTSEMQMAMPGMPVPSNSAGSMTGDGLLWVAKGVGVIKHTDNAQTGSGQSSSSTTELKKMKRPLSKK